MNWSIPVLPKSAMKDDTAMPNKGFIVFKTQLHRAEVTEECVKL